MKRLVKPLILMLSLGAIASCTKKAESVVIDPVIVNSIADYTITADATDGFTFKYNNLSKNYAKLEWRFGDDTLKTEASPTHTFLAAGKYTTDLKTFSSTGNFSHKYVDINIVPDSIIKVTAVKNGIKNQLQFNVTVKAKIKSILWTINDVDASSGKVTTTTDTTLSPVHTFGVGTFNNFTVQVTTDKGSVTSLSRSVTVEGIAINITQSYLNNTPLYPSLISTNENTAQGANEGSSKLVDGNVSTKFGFYSAFPVPEIITLQFPAPVVVKIYGLCNGNDSNSSRDPKEWYIEGSTDNFTWVALDHITLTKGFYDMATDLGVKGNGPTGIDARYRKWWYYPIATPGAYTWYRWRVVSTFQNAFQMSEIAFFK